MSKPAEQLTLSEILTICAMRESYLLSGFEAEQASLMAQNLATLMQKVASRLANKMLEVEIKRHHDAELRKQAELAKILEERERKRPFIMPD